MSAGHTAGPLIARDLGNEWEVVKEDASAIDGVWFVALCYDAADDGSAEANARLIAAAPELVEALRPFAKAADEAVRPDIRDEDIFSPDVTFGDLRRARAALSKALGNDGGEG